MSVIKIRQALEVALNAMSPALATAWENVNFTPTAGTAFQVVNFIFAEPDNATMGSGFYTERGTMQIRLCYPTQTGTLNAATRAELLRTTFKRGNTFTKDAVRVIIQRTPEIATGYIEGDRFILTVKIRFYANINV
jgi:hypothetical protein